MKRNTRRIARLAAVLVALAVGVGLVQSAAADSGSAGLARAILMSQYGFSAGRAESWTSGACSYQERPASCYLTPAQARAVSVAEATALGAYRGMTAQQAYDWSVGVCSYADKPSSCYLSPTEAAAQSKALAVAMGVPSVPVAATTSGSSGFSWGDAGIGAAAMLGVVLLAVGLGFTYARRRVRSLRHA